MLNEIYMRFAVGVVFFGMAICTIHAIDAHWPWQNR